MRLKNVFCAQANYNNLEALDCFVCAIHSLVVSIQMINITFLTNINDDHRVRIDEFGGPDSI